jgi:hypothetical protein
VPLGWAFAKPSNGLSAVKLERKTLRTIKQLTEARWSGQESKKHVTQRLNKLNK